MKVAIITLYGFFNYGNRLQNYALQEAIEKLGCDVVSISVDSKKEIIKGSIKRYIEKKDGKICFVPSIERVREKNFRLFTSDHIKTKHYTRASRAFDSGIESDFDCFVVGSDQVWNPLFWEKEGFEKSANNYLLKFVKTKKKIAYAASYGVGEIKEEHRSSFAENLPFFDCVTVREEVGACISKSIANVDAEVVLDPTMLLDKDEWRSIEKGYYSKSKKYVAVYFLGEQPDSVHKKIFDYAKKIDADVIDIMDISNKIIYQRGPESFIELIDNAEACFTDSFHASVFSIIFHTPFVTYGRKHANKSNMNSRIETLLKTLALQDRMCFNVMADLNMECDFETSDMLLKKERMRSITILKNAIER